MLYVVNYADGTPYELFRKECTKSAYWLGRADKVIEYTRSDIPASYINANKRIFSYQRGAGLWLWKPFLVNKALETLNVGDWLFYTDGGALFIRDIHKLIKCAETHETDIMLFEQPLLQRQFTKHETMVKMGIEEKGLNQTLGIFLLQKNERTVSLMKEWLSCCEQEELISPNIFNQDIEEYADFVAHREDQSILSALRIKYDITAFRDPSDYGEMPFQYATNRAFIYHPVRYTNSNYPTVMLCSRKTRPVSYLLQYIIRKILWTLNIRWTESFFLKRFQCKKI